MLTGLHHDPVDCFKECLVQIVFLQKPPELEQRRCIRGIFLKEINPDESAHGIAVVDRILNAFIRQIEPALKQIHPQHLFNSLRRSATLSARIIRLDILHPFLPWDDFVHDLEKLLALGFAFPCAVFHVADGLLLHSDAPPLLDTYIISAIGACAYRDLISGSLYIKSIYVTLSPNSLVLLILACASAGCPAISIGIRKGVRPLSAMTRKKPNPVGSMDYSTALASASLTATL